MFICTKDIIIYYCGRTGGHYLDLFYTLKDIKNVFFVIGVQAIRLLDHVKVHRCTNTLRL